jgi:hypothetical protein
MKRDTGTDYSLANKTIKGLDLYGEITVKPIKTANFRKYIRDVLRDTDIEVVTKTVDGMVRVTRLK